MDKKIFLASVEVGDPESAVSETKSLRAEVTDGKISYVSADTLSHVPTGAFETLPTGAEVDVRSFVEGRMREILRRQTGADDSEISVNEVTD